MNGEYAALANRIRTRLHDLERVVNRSTYLLEQAKMKSDDGYLDGVALNLHGFYAGAEEELTKDLEGCYSTFKQDLEEFINFLHEQTNADID